MKKQGLVLLLLLLATVLVYINGLNNPFVPDDQGIVLRNSEPWQGRSLRDMLNRSLFSTAPSESSYFRPLTLFTFVLNSAVGGKNPQGYRLFNLALHLFVIGLMTLLLTRLAGKWVAVFSALLYAVHPVHVQAVSYISSRSDPLYTSLALLCLLFWNKGNETRGIRRVIYLCSALIAFFLGLFAKETMIVVPVLALVMDLAWNRTGSWRNEIRENLAWYGALAVLFGIYLLFRLELGYHLLMERGQEFSFGSRVLLALKLSGLYLGLAFYPAHLSLFRVVAIPETFLEWQVVLGTLALAGMVIVAVILWPLRKEISFGILWFLISLLPVLNLTLLNAPMMEHWLYLPLIGLSLAFVGGVRILAERIREIRGASLGLILIALLLSARTVTRNADWNDLLKLFSRDVSSYPGNFLAWSWLGDALRERRMLHDAIRAYRMSVFLNPNRSGAWANLGQALSMAERNDEAETALSKAVSIRPREPRFHYLLGIHRLKIGKNRAAIESLEKSISLASLPMAYHALGSAYLRLGEKERGEQAFHKAITIYPGGYSFHAATHADFARLYLTQERYQDAKEEAQIALRFDPNNSEAKALLGRGPKNP